MSRLSLGMLGMAVTSVVVADVAVGVATYSAKVVEFDTKPLLSAVDGTSAFAQAFNPSWVEATNLTGGVAGLLVRVQNCTGCGVGYDPIKAPEDSDMCCRCAGTDSNASKIAFSQKQSPSSRVMVGNSGNGLAPRKFTQSTDGPQFAPLHADSVVFAPHNDSDIRGTEDPRIQFDPATNLYYMFYTCWNKDMTATLCLATSANPTSESDWTRHGPVFGEKDSKSAALVPPSLRRPGKSDDAVYTLIHGAGVISYTESTDPLVWNDFGSEFITNVTWASGGGNFNVEAGPPPMKLSDGNLVFFFNSWCNDEEHCPPDNPPPGYQPVWVSSCCLVYGRVSSKFNFTFEGPPMLPMVCRNAYAFQAVLNGSDPRQILAKADAPLWTPMEQPWMSGTAPYTCNVQQVHTQRCSRFLP